MDVHNALTKAATHAATLAQSAAMLGWGTATEASEAGCLSVAQENLDRKSGAVDSQISKAETALQEALQGT